MNKLISTNDEAIENIEKFNKELREFGDTNDIPVRILIDNIPNVRSWYVHEKNGKFIFGPSKYIGYKDIDAEDYSEYRKMFDGRMTEKTLSKWYELISVKHPKYSQLSTELEKFCSQFGKHPNSLFRINILLVEQDNDSLEDDIVELIWKIYLGLSQQKKEFIKSKINKFNINKN